MDTEERSLSPVLGKLTKLSIEDYEDSSNETCVDFSEMPEEILVHIFSYIDADYLLNVVSKVSKNLHAILTDDQYWKMRLYRRFPEDYPIVLASDFYMAKDSKECICSWRVWKKSNSLQKQIVLSPSSGCTVNCIHMTEDRNLCISGSRDHSMTVWRLSPEPGANNNTDAGDMFCKYLTNHKGWVWSINSRQGELCSTSFDSTVKYWDANVLEMTQSIRAQAAVLCSSYLDDHSMAVGCFNRKTLILDKRSGSIERFGKFHRGSVLKIQCEDNHLISTGEDGVMAIVDVRQMKILQKIKTHGFAMALNSSGKQIWTGNRNGSIQVYNAKNIGRVFEAAKLDYGFSGKVTSLQYTSGAVYAGSTDGWLKIYQPTLNPDCLGELQLANDGVTDIALMDYRLAVANGNGMVALWDPDTKMLMEDDNTENEDCY